VNAGRRVATLTFLSQTAPATLRWDIQE